MTQPPQNNNPYPVPGPNGEPVQPAPAANGYQAPAANGYQAPVANGYQAPNMNGMPSYPGQQGFMPTQAVAPDAEEKLKRSQIVLLATAGSYALVSIASYFLVTRALMESMQAELGTSGSAAGAIGSFIGTAIALVLFGMVYLMMQKRKKIGRIFGYIFAGLGIAAALLNLFTSFGVSIVLVLLYAVWLGLSIYWIVAVSNKSVSSILR